MISCMISWSLMYDITGLNLWYQDLMISYTYDITDSIIDSGPWYHVWYHKLESTISWSWIWIWRGHADLTSSCDAITSCVTALANKFSVLAPAIPAPAWASAELGLPVLLDAHIRLLARAQGSECLVSGNRYLTIPHRFGVLEARPGCCPGPAGPPRALQLPPRPARPACPRRGNHWMIIGYDIIQSVA
jgi:hypothetical protein